MLFHFGDDTFGNITVNEFTMKEALKWLVLLKVVEGVIVIVVVVGFIIAVLIARLVFHFLLFRCLRDLLLPQ